MANEGLGLGFAILKMVPNPGGDCYWEGGQPMPYAIFKTTSYQNVYPYG